MYISWKYIKMSVLFSKPLASLYEVANLHYIMEKTKLVC